MDTLESEGFGWSTLNEAVSRLKRSGWTAEEKLALVLEGIKGTKAVAELCREHQIAQTQYYQWRDRFLEGGKRALTNGLPASVEAHPFWGYRRVWGWLRYREGLLVNKKRVYRLMREAGWTVQRARHGATRTPRVKPHATRPRQYWGIDRRKFLIPWLGWAYLVVVLDWYTKKIVGWDVSLRSRRQEWEAALLKGRARGIPRGRAWGWTEAGV